MGFKDSESPGHKSSLSCSLFEKHDSASKTREEVKLPMNHSGYLNFSYTLTCLSYLGPLARREKRASWGIDGFIARVFTDSVSGGGTLRLPSDAELFPWCICAKHPHANFLQTLQARSSSLSWNPSEVGMWEAVASLARHATQLQLVEWMGEMAYILCSPGFLMQYLCLWKTDPGVWPWGCLGNWPCFKAGIKPHFRTVQGLGFTEARRALSRSERLYSTLKEGREHKHR